MTLSTAQNQATRPARVFLVLAIVLLFVELTALGTLFKHGIDFECLANWPQPVCRNASRSLVAIYCLLGVTALLFMLRPAPLKTLTQDAGSRFWPLAINGAGVLVALVPFVLLSGATGRGGIVPSLMLWGVGAALMLAGIALFIAPLDRWRDYMASEWSALLPAVAGALAAPFLSVGLQPIWSIEWIADQTFGAVAWLMRLMGYDQLYADPVQKMIGADDFFIKVANVCSGIEGIALVTLFVSLYLWLFRKDLRFPRAFLLYPIGIAASVAFNILRITILLFIGLEGNPELAVGGFHSHAGWMMFTLVALGVIALAQTVPALRKTHDVTSHATRAAPLPFLQDPIVAQILPFAVFMLSALVASTLSQIPSAVYPIRVVLMCGVLALVWPYFRGLAWRIDPVALAVGAFIAAYWVLIPVEATDTAPPYGTLSGVMLVAWFVARGFGTIVLIPIIEEAFFRGYLETRLRLGTGLAWRIGAALMTAALFAALHGRWAEAFVAGLLFSWVAARRGNIADAILSHSVANALIFATAVISGNLAMI
ncbi:exosortase E/protease, VPEID-CTERM system [Octadecabacter sp. 1_MG-2023]|uniref:exosortase E/protease, VPEID-CTERM system n=1 Tax=unclassified Octadecabacter TaxID=196158 RepID=UPI001C09A42E|nr:MULTISPECIES: exosortase E/protease, VPEID-CTERM system [unclassified Octadecabacter]MBU2993997.1 exosortase E/protease, VPEID-CTERM system [Octadecabacter sp. B2R22]MDO6736060.1 exosortase E/protease, VPEID-CTERM system [Octadecabacter sp. 1_MG-2023]